MKRPKKTSTGEQIPVRIASPANRPLQLRYTDPTTKRDVRISTGTNDESEAERQRKELEAKLLLGLQVHSKRELQGGPTMSWDAFRDRYTNEHLAHQRDSTALNAESRLDLATKIIKPTTLQDLACSDALSRLRNELYRGAYSPKLRARSMFTVRGYMKSILAALNWAYDRHWLETKPRTEKFGRIKQRAMRGRPITLTEFEQMLLCVPTVVGTHAAPSWSFLLHGLWESGFRLGEIMKFSWDDPTVIYPVWPDKGLPYIVIPGDAQKNGDDETIPMLPGLEKLLKAMPPEKQTGWIFDPITLWDPAASKRKHFRPETDWVSRVIAKIGFKADILVRGTEADKAQYLTWKKNKAKDKKIPPYSGNPVKFASAHDLRRSLADRLRNDGVNPLIITRVLRHSSWEVTSRFYAPGDIQREAEEIRRTLGN